MNRTRSTLLIAMLAIAMVALAACAAPTPTPTPVPPTAVPKPTDAPKPTAVPPTAVPPTAVPPTAMPAAKSPVIAVSQNATLGKFITDGDGMTLYMYPRDTREPSASNCYDDCAKRWPPLLTDSGKAEFKGTEIDQKLFGTITRKEGTKQLTFNGWPLYYFSNDKKAGDTLGQGVGDIWWVMVPDGAITTGPVTVAIDVVLAAGRDADQSGTARLTARGDKTDVALTLKPGAAGAAQPAHIHEGACPAPGAVKYALKDVVDGKSTTTLDVALSALLTGGFAINAHKSASEIGVYVACGNLPQGSVVKLDKGRDDDQNGTAVLVSQGAKTEVNLFIKPAPGVAQPAHIHEGACPVPGAVKYPLTNIAEGKSKTVVEVALADLLKGGFAINAHKSVADAAKYVACGNLKSSATAAPALPPVSMNDSTGYGK